MQLESNSEIDKFAFRHGDLNVLFTDLKMLEKSLMVVAWIRLLKKLYGSNTVEKKKKMVIIYIEVLRVTKTYIYDYSSNVECHW